MIFHCLLPSFSFTSCSLAIFRAIRNEETVLLIWINIIVHLRNSFKWIFKTFPLVFNVFSCFFFFFVQALTTCKQTLQSFSIIYFEHMKYERSENVNRNLSMVMPVHKFSCLFRIFSWNACMSIIFFINYFVLQWGNRLIQVKVAQLGFKQQK